MAKPIKIDAESGFSEALLCNLSGNPTLEPDKSLRSVVFSAAC